MRWEYLRVEIAASVRGGHSKPSHVWVIGSDGLATECLKQPGDTTHGPVVSRLLNELGQQGWELAGTVSVGETGNAVLYFKRSKG
jgi:hypothetical protein